MTTAKTSSTATVTLERTGAADNARAGGRDVSPATSIQQIDLELLDASLLNPRRTMHEADLQELAASIREHGIQVPLLVRSSWSRVDGPERFEIVAGHRRSEAATIAGLTSVPCIVRELSDEQAAEISIIDNLQRVDVPAMEEAQAFGELLDRLLSIAAVASRVGKEQCYVAKRLKLRTCTEHTRRALSEQLITVDHALLLARLGEDEQNQALVWTLNQGSGVKTAEDAVEEAIDGRGVSWNQWEPQTVARLKQHIERESGTKLSRAPWPMEEDHLLPDVGSCLGCEKNTSANAPLFGDLLLSEPMCTDGGCFKAKVSGYVQIQLSDATKQQADAEDGPAIRLSWKAANKKPRVAQLKPGSGVKDVDGFNAFQTFGLGQWIEAKPKSCPHVRLGVAVDWKLDAIRYGYSSGDHDHKPGEILQVCIAESCKVHKKAYLQASKQTASGSARESQEEREELSNAFKAAETPLRRALYDAIIAKLSGLALRRTVLIEQDEVYGIAGGLGIRDDKNWNKTKKQVQAAIGAADEAELDRLMFHAAFSRELEPGYYDYNEKDKGRGKLRELAKLAGVDAAAIEKAAEPKPQEKPTDKPAKKAAPEKAAKPGVLSAEAKKRIAAAQKKRWAAASKKKGGK